MRIANGVTNRAVHFVAVDATDGYTRETGLSGFTVDYEIDDDGRAQMTTPTVAEVDSTNMPGVYRLDIDESGMTTIVDAGVDDAELILHIEHASMRTVNIAIEIYRPKITAGETLTVAADGLADVNVVEWAGTDVTGDGDWAELQTDVDAILVDTGTTLQAELDGIQADTEDIQSKIGTPSDMGGGATLAANNTDMGGATFNASTDTLEAIRNRLVDVETDTQDIQSRLPAALVSGRIDASVGAMAAGVVTAAAIATDAIDADALAADAIAEINATVDTALSDYDAPTKAELDAGLAALNDPTAAAIADAVWDEATTGHVTAGTFGEQLKTDVDAILADTNELQTDDYPTTLAAMDAKLDTIDNFLDTEVAAILEDTGTTIPAQISALNNISAAEVNAEVDAAIETYHLDHLLAATYDPASKPGAADALLNELVESDAGVSRFTANALEQAPTGGSAPSAADIADAVLDEALSGHTTAGTLGKAIADIESDVTAVLADTDELQTDDIPGLVSALESLISAIKAKTDSLTFTQTGHVDANIKRVADATVTGSGTEADPWGP